MRAISWASCEDALSKFGFTVEHFPNSSTVRVLPPSPYYLVSVPCNRTNSFSMQCLHGRDSFYCIGREGKLQVPRAPTGLVQAKQGRKPIWKNGPLFLSLIELLEVINGTQPYRCSTLDDFYVIPASGTLMLYVSHHDEVLLYAGWAQGDSNCIKKLFLGGG